MILGLCLLTALAAAVPREALGQNALPQTQNGVQLLAPLGDQQSIPVTAGLGTFLTYFNDAGVWLIRVAMGVCIFWILNAGYELMGSGVFSSNREKGRQHIIWALVGLVILLFAGTILRLLNSLFFQ